MGRLFWKVFAFTLLAQLIATLGIGGAIWLKHATNDAKMGQIDRSPPAAVMIKAAASTLQYGGVSALRSLLENQDPHRPVVAVADDGRELLGRAVDPLVAAKARELLQSTAPHQVVRQVQGPDGSRYLLFAPVQPGDEHGFEGGNYAPPGPRGIFVDRQPPPFDREDRRPESDRRPQPDQDSEPPPPHNQDDGRHRSPQDMFFLPFLPLASAVLGSLIFALLLAWYFSKPIRSLRSAFTAVAGGDLGVHLGADMGARRDELADLGRDFDTMVERLGALMDGQRRLLHDVSHELRSPLARLQAAIGLARQQPEKMESSLDRIERESVRMDKLVGELLTLSKLEAGALTPNKEEVNVDELLDNLVVDARFEAEASGRKLEFSGNSGLTLKGDAELLHRALENVLRNALKQTPIHSTVLLEAEIDPASSTLCIVIHDRGPGVPESELNQIFEPFFRGVESVKSTDGHGLGLAIAQRVVAAHGGSIRASNRQGGGLTVEIRLPLAP